MKYILYAVIFLSSVLIMVENSSAEERITFNGWSKDGYIYENYIEISKLKNLPDWNPENGTPPLSLLKAIEISKQYVSNNSPEFYNYEISNVQLTQFLIPEFHKDKWYYNVIFMNNISVKDKSPKTTSVVVFLDGSIADVTQKKVEVDKEILRRMRDNLNKQLGEN